MKKILIGTHGAFASGIKSSIQILFGQSEQIEVIDAYLDDSRIEDRIDAYFAKVDSSDQVIMMSDLVGGSVNQIMFRYLERENTMLISGINLALVLEIAADRSEMSKERIQAIIEEARKAMILVEDEDLEEAQESFF